MWSDIATLKEEFGLDDTLTEAEVRKALKKLLVKVHPDSTKGEFVDEEQKQKYERISLALRFLKSSTPSANISVFSGHDLARIVEQQKALVEAVNKSNELIVSTLSKQNEGVIAAENTRRADDLIKATRNSLREQSIQRYRPITISGASLAGIAALLLTFKGPLEELSKSTIFASFSHAQSITTALIVCVGLLAGGLAFLSNLRQTRENERREFILTEAGFRQFLFSKQLLSSLEYMYDEDESFDGISLADLANAVADFANLHEASSSQMVAEVFYQRLIDRRIATAAPGGFLSPTLKLSDSFAGDLRYGNHERLEQLKWLGGPKLPSKGK